MDGSRLAIDSLTREQAFPAMEAATKERMNAPQNPFEEVTLSANHKPSKDRAGGSRRAFFCLFANCFSSAVFGRGEAVSTRAYWLRRKNQNLGFSRHPLIPSPAFFGGHEQRPQTERKTGACLLLIARA